MNKIIKLIVAMAALTICFSCNDEWKDEQFAHYVGFKAPINSDGCTTVYVKYNEDGETVHYQLPLIVSGSTVHEGTINAVVELDPDSLYTLNMANIGERRMDIWFKDLSDVEEHDGVERVLNEFPTTVTIPAGQTTALLDLELNLKDLDQSYRWILPLKVAENQPGYQANTRKHYNNALLNIIPFNDFSGTYVASSMLGSVQKVDGNGLPIQGEYDEDVPYAVSDKIFYATGENTAFFYAGGIDYTHKDRDNYRVNVEFGDDGESLRFWASETAKKAGLNFSVSNNNVTYFVAEEPDPLKNYLLRKTTVVNVEYYMTDRTQGEPLNYKFKGAYSMLRIINTQIPDQDQAIQW
jgi:hypothetical protein